MPFNLPQDVLSEELVSDICKKNGFYRTPELNEKLYLHYRGFRQIQALDAFYNTKCLWLDSNCINHIECLEALTKLHSLHLQNNCISTLLSSKYSTKQCESALKGEYQSADEINYSGFKEGKTSSEFEQLATSPTLVPKLTTAPLPSVRFLDISHNLLDTLKHIPIAFPNLEQLFAKDNHLTELDIAITALQFLTVLDVSENRIGQAFQPAHSNSCEKLLSTSALKDEAICELNYGGALDSEYAVCTAGDVAVVEAEKTVAILSSLPRLSSLRMEGNPLSRILPFYRRRLIAQIKNLNYLDSYPVFEDERRAVMAFVDGGLTAEAQEYRKIKAEKQYKRNKQRQFFTNFITQNSKNGEEENSEYFMSNVASVKCCKNRSGEDFIADQKQNNFDVEDEMSDVIVFS